MDECKSLADSVPSFAMVTTLSATRRSSLALAQGLTLVHFSAQRKRFLWERGCV